MIIIAIMKTRITAIRTIIVLSVKLPITLFSALSAVMSGTL